MKRLVHLAVATTALVGLAACSSDSKSTNNKGTEAATPTNGVTTPDVTAPDISLPDISIPDISIPDFSIPDISIPAMSDECMAFYKDFAGALSGQTGPEALDSFFQNLKDSVPDELKDDAAIVADTMSTYLKIVAKYGNDITKLMADPDAQKALEALNSPAFTAASDNITKYMDSICPQS